MSFTAAKRGLLKLKNGMEVGTLEELKNNFSAEEIWDLWNRGELRVWLEERYYDDIVEEIEAIEKEKNAENRLYGIFGVEKPETLEDDTDITNSNRRERLELLKKYIKDKERCHEYGTVIDYIAFSQDELYDLLDRGEEEIYLCGDKFEIPISKENIIYYGLNEPVVALRVKEKMDLELETGIQFVNVRFGEDDLKNAGIRFLIEYKEPDTLHDSKLFANSGNMILLGRSIGLGFLFGANSRDNIRKEIISIICESEQVDADEAESILKEICESAGENDTIPAVYKLMTCGERTVAMDWYGDTVKAIYGRCFS